MSETSIEWTDVTWNPVRGCSRISDGCKNCYAERQAARFSDPGQYAHGFVERTKSGPRWTGKVELVPSKLEEPLRWKTPHRVFVNSMSDLFHESLSDDAIAAVFGVMCAAPLQTFQVLTKRADRMRDWSAWIRARGGLGVYIRSEAGRPKLRPFFDAVVKLETVNGRHVRVVDDPWMRVMNAAACWQSNEPLPNVWLGVSCEDQNTADERIPILLHTPAAVRFVSAEPLLGPLDIRGPHGSRWMPELATVTSRQGPRVELVGSRSSGEATLGTLDLRVGDRISIRNGPAIDWVIIGGESGPGARPCCIDWISSIVEDCLNAGVPPFVKQLGAVVAGPKRSHDPVLVSPYVWQDGVADRIKLKDRKGGDPGEWPVELRVREFPRDGARSRA